MYFKAFHAEFEKIARLQTRSLTIVGEQKIPKGDYAFLPMYCKDKKCDCRRTLINVLQVTPEYGPFHAATISYGWEPLDFYRDWAKALSEEEIKIMKGPALDHFNTQSPSASHLLESFVNLVLDDDYSERLKRQYAMFKYKIGMKLPPDLEKQADLSGECPCGSGRPFKLCCGRGKFSRRYRR
ncbi:MAG: SEC-C domain-containing protein [Lewinellaceae bacterium]|nr:SEC-C domain-containing protein [Phaeodactylibacter sp.]MCB9041937.1 SEC-C domain-containing protein [Lewinellaceae bacterium]